MPAKQIPDLEWKFEEVQLVEPVLVQIYHLPEQAATTENDRPECQQLVETEKTESQDTGTSQEDQGVATIETDHAVHSQITASESSALKILETLIFLLISLATVAVLF